MRKIVLAALVLGLALVPRVASAAAAPSCSPRLLVLSAFPAELGNLISASRLDRPVPVSTGGRNFYEGQLDGQRVVMALTGIGPVNARITTEAAFAHYRCGSRGRLSGVVFSGVAGGGGPSLIGDVTVPKRWTGDGGASWQRADPAMVATASRVAPSARLSGVTPLGDPTCLCQNPELVKSVTLKHVPRVIVGGDGSTTDPFGGRAVPCLPDGGDLGGCEPCATALHVAPDASRLVSGVIPLLNPGFIQALVTPAPASAKSFVANDEETAAVGRVAVLHKTPFVAFRGISDGGADPLGLPGFPSQFVVYKQLAADNAAALTRAFLKAWRA